MSTETYQSKLDDFGVYVFDVPGHDESTRNDILGYYFMWQMTMYQCFGVNGTSRLYRFAENTCQIGCTTNCLLLFIIKTTLNIHWTWIMQLNDWFISYVCHVRHKQYRVSSHHSLSSLTLTLPVYEPHSYC